MLKGKGVGGVKGNIYEYVTGNKNDDDNKNVKRSKY